MITELLKYNKQTLAEYKRMIKRENPSYSDFFAKIVSILSIHFVHKIGNTNKAKLAQIRRLLTRTKYSNKGYGFVYSIDTDIYPVSIGKIIGNMPIDYSIIVNYSLNDMFTGADNNIAIQNRYMIEVLKCYILRYCKHIEDEEYRNYVSGIIDKRADSLKEALQRILFINQLLWQTHHRLVGLGRLDLVLNRFELPKDGEKIITDFLLTLHSFYNYKSNVLIGDTGQIIILGGNEEGGNYFCNEYTYLFIKCIKKINKPDPKILLRVSSKMPSELLSLAIDCISTGCGSPLLSNDEKIIPLLNDFGYSIDDAYNYCVSACWEPLSLGNSLEQNNLAHIEYGRISREMICDKRFVQCSNIEDVYKIFLDYLNIDIDRVIKLIDSINWEKDPILTLFTKGCFEAAKDISDGGAKYCNYGVLSIGLSAAVNSFINIKEKCFEKKQLSLVCLQDAIMNNFVGYDTLKKSLSDNIDGFGTDSTYAIMLSNRIISDTENILCNYRNKFGGAVKFGLSSPNYLYSGQKIGATADGRSAGMPFTTHISRDRDNQVTELIIFASKLNLSGLSANANVADMMMQPDIINKSKEKIIRLVESAIKLGIFQMQFNVLSYNMLIDAKNNPEKYPDLIVRVWGFSAYFNDLPNDFQDMLIERARKSEEL